MAARGSRARSVDPPKRAADPGAVNSAKTSRMNVMQVLGKTGLPEYAGYLFDEWLPELQGAEGMKILREMSDNDAMVGALLFSIEMLLRNVDWNVDQGEEGLEFEEAASFIYDALHDMDVTWEDTLSEILTFLIYGFSLHELVYKRRRGQLAMPSSKYDDGALAWDSWPMRAQETAVRWEFGPGQTIDGMWQLGPPDWKYHFIPLSKAMNFRASTRRGNPQGRSILRTCYRAWFLKKTIENIEAVGIERDLAGYPVISIPAHMLRDDAEEEDKHTYELFKQAVRQIRRDELEGMVMPLAYDENGNKLYTFELLKGSGTRAFNTDDVIGRYNEQIVTSVLAGFLMLGHEGTGSYALGSAIGSMFTTALGAWLGMVASQVNNVAIPRLLRLNGYSDAVLESPPQLKHGEIAEPDLEMIGKYLQAIGMSASGAQLSLDTRPDSPLMKRLMALAHLPEPPEAENVAITASERPTVGGRYVKEEVKTPPAKGRRQPTNTPAQEMDAGQRDFEEQMSALIDSHRSGTPTPGGNGHRKAA